MRLEQYSWHEPQGFQPSGAGQLAGAQLVLVFGGANALRKTALLDRIRTSHPGATVLGCSTAGEICGTSVQDDSLVVTAVQFESARVLATSRTLDSPDKSFETGAALAKDLDPIGLVHVFVLSEGLRVNGSELVKGLTSQLPPEVRVTGGLSGDGGRFQETCILCGDKLSSGAVAAIGLYGDRLRVGYGSLGGWDPFGPERVITRSRGNVLFELDGTSALAVYKRYLGEHAAGLPATGLLYPLAIRTKDSPTPIVRTILAVDEESQTMTFAGDVPEGAFARLMKANFNRLIDGAAGAARTSYEAMGSRSPQLGVLISCVGRKMVLKQRIEEEVEAVRDVLGADTVLTGFYSYGEISPFTPNARCEQHNQTMTITTISEI